MDDDCYLAPVERTQCLQKAFANDSKLLAIVEKQWEQKCHDQELKHDPDFDTPMTVLVARAKAQANQDTAWGILVVIECVLLICAVVFLAVVLAPILIPLAALLFILWMLFG